jgi:hypothetical protein
MSRYFSSLFRSAHWLLVIALVAIGFNGNAQTTNGTIAGTVVDPTGAAVSGATITATSLQTNETRTVSTGKVGAYRIESVRPGPYRIEVSAPSFEKTTVNGTQVDPSVVTSVNVTLAAGSATEAVEVNGSAIALLNTDSGQISETISTVEMQNLPIANLNPYSLAFTLPGVTQVFAADFTNGTAFGANGGRPRSNNFLIEGVDNNDQGLHGQAFQPENVEAYDQATFLLSSFPAEFGRGGTVSNLLLLSGSNTFHGAAYERLYNSSLDATDKADVLNQNPKAKYRENIFGFRFGGPIIHNRLFFFVSNQWDRYRTTANLGILTVPTAAGFTTLQSLFPNNPRVKNLLSAYGPLRGTNQLYAKNLDLGPDPSCVPTPSVPCASRGSIPFAGVQRQLGSGSNSRELEATSDLVVSDKDKLRFRFIQSPYSTPYDTGNFPDQLPGFDTEQSGTVYNAGIVHTHVFSASLLNELRLAWSRIGFSFDLRPETYANPLALAPAISITNITGYGIPAGTVPQGRFQNTYQLQEALSWTRGSHSLKFGFDIEDQRIKDGIPFNYYGSISYTDSKTSSPTTNYTALGNYVDDFGGTATNGAAGIQFGNPTARPEIWVQSYYAQDTWKVLPALTLEYGLRYEYNGAPLNYLPNPGFNSSNPTAFPGGVPQISDKTNIAPRLGINYSLNNKTVLSAGFGIFYDHVFTNIIDNIQGSSPNAASKTIYTSTSGRGTAAWSNILNTITNKNPLPGDTSNVASQHLLDPLTYQYNLRLQRQLPSDFAVSAAYVGNRTLHDYATTEFNPFIAGGPRLYPSRGRIIREDNTADSNYNSGQFEIERRGKGGLTLRASYTFSKMLDDGSEIFTSSTGNLSTYSEIQYPASRAREYAASAFDHRNIFAAAVVYQPPTWHPDGGLRVAAAVVNGWTLGMVTNFQSGQPVNPEIGYDWNGDGIGNDRPILGNKHAPLTTWAIKGEDFFPVNPGTLCDGAYFWDTNDPCHVVTADQVHWITSNFYTTQNTAGRNSLFADHQTETDMSIGRSFRTFEHQDFLFRAEAINVFNHGNTNAFNASLVTGTFSPGNGSNTFGDSSLTVSGHRNLRFYVRYQF